MLVLTPQNNLYQAAVKGVSYVLAYTLELYRFLSTLSRMMVLSGFRDRRGLVRYRPTVRLVVAGIKSFSSHRRPISSVVHPFRLTSKRQSPRRPSNYAWLYSLPLKMRVGGSAQLDALIDSIAVTHSQFPGCIDGLRDRPYCDSKGGYSVRILRSVIYIL
jgi:hypothetical protein